MKLGEICFQITDGKHGDCRDKPNSGYYFLSAKDVFERNLNYDDVREIEEEDFLETHRRTNLQPGDLLVTNSGTIGRVSIARDETRTSKTTFQKSVAILKPKRDIVDSLFLYYALVHKRPQIQEVAGGTTQQNLLLKDIRDFDILTPSLSEQHAIAYVLGALDDKIELNRRMNATLEEMARAVFRQWFVENEEVGNWQIGILGDDFNLTMGQSPPGETYNEEGNGVPFFQGRSDFGFRFPTNRVFCSTPTRFAEAGDTLVSVRAPVGDINMAVEKCAIGRGVAAVKHKTGSRSYTYYAMHYLQEDFFRFEGEGTVFGSINKSDFEGLKIAIPPVNTVMEFEKVCFPIDQMIENNEKESRTLANLRDTLLPKLMRGEVRVRDADA